MVVGVFVGRYNATIGSVFSPTSLRKTKSLPIEILTKIAHFTLIYMPYKANFSMKIVEKKSKMTPLRFLGLFSYIISKKLGSIALNKTKF